MLNWLRKEWLFVAALVVAGCFWVLALNGTLASFLPRIEGSIDHASNEGNQGHPLSDFWDWLTKDSISFFTAVLAVFTGALVVIALRADKTSKRLARISKRQLKIQAAQTDLMEKQKEIARQEFLATHRPKLRIRLLKVDEPIPNLPVTVRYEIVNVGDGQANAITSAITLQVMTDLQARKWTSWSKEFAVPDSLIAGESVEVTQVTDATFAKGFVMSKVRVRGIVAYSDGPGTRRKTGFFRERGESLNRFRRIDDQDIASDYEYED